MPLICGGRPVEESGDGLVSFVTNLPYIKTGAEKLCKMEARELDYEGVLYVHQREIAAVAPPDEAVRFLGSEDATTCHLVVLREQNTSATCLCHFDTAHVTKVVQKMMAAVRGIMKKKASGDTEPHYILHVVGGFDDERELSLHLSHQLLSAFHGCPEKIHVETACVSRLNNVVVDDVNTPCIYGIAVDVDTGEIFPAKFKDKGPEELLRHIRLYAETIETVEMYDWTKHEVRVEPFIYQRFANEEYWLEAPDEFILQNLSTSPHCEPPDFVAKVKETIQYLRKNPWVLTFTLGPKTFSRDSTGRWAPPPK